MRTHVDFKLLLRFEVIEASKVYTYTSLDNFSSCVYSIFPALQNYTNISCTQISDSWNNSLTLYDDQGDSGC